MRSAGSPDLAVINNVVNHAIETWNLPERVRRLAKPSLTYTESDLDFMLAALGENEEGNAIAAALWEPEEGRLSRHSSILLHGLYVMPEYQRNGVGACMVEHVSKIARKAGFHGMTVKSWRDSEDFFLKLGFSDSAISGQERLYPRQLWKPV